MPVHTPIKSLKPFRVKALEIFLQRKNALGWWLKISLEIQILCLQLLPRYPLL